MGLFGKKDEAALPPAAPAPAPAKPAAKGSQKNTSLATTYIGKNLNIKGNISGEGSIIILGSFEGKFHLDGHLKVAQGAEIKGKPAGHQHICQRQDRRRNCRHREGPVGEYRQDEGCHRHPPDCGS